MIRKCLVVFVFYLSGAMTAQANESLDTGSHSTAEVTDQARKLMETRISEWFDAHQQINPDAYAAWLEKNRTGEALSMAPIEARLEMYSFDAGRWGGLQGSKIEFPEPFLGVGEAQPVSGGMPIRVIFQFEDTAPYRIGPMVIGVAVDIPEEWASLDELTRSLLKSTGVPALAIGVMQDGKVVDQTVQGVRQLGSAEQVSPGDTFHWGSIAKSVTGTMIAKLIEDGVLDWDSTIGEVLKDVPMRNEYRHATLSQLMSHEAGIQQYENFTAETVEEILAAAEGNTWTAKRGAFVARALMEEPLAPPGEVHAYSNAGITIAGYMAEVTTGRSWNELVEEHVFRPLGMTSAGFDWPAADDRPDQPRGHFGDNPENYQVMEPGQMVELLNLLAPAGNVRSSLEDLMRYGNFHLQGMTGQDGYLKAGTVQRLHTPRADSVPWGGSFYTFGWGHNECLNFYDAPDCQAHNGGAGSFYAEIRILPGRNMVLAYMANAAEPSEAISQDVLAAVYERFARLKMD